ncbi:ras-related protein Rab-26 isoform X2 [Gouania willdenowi]|uniref:ras-related protein Rab-26 isoform X2 n=1 Tax=Gouania willdenowi TaxID=441366 RepID=UPI001055D708|nr:ras-related protein Rab-26-like isoform X2 [Gouania willdenowi]
MRQQREKQQLTVNKHSYIVSQSNRERNKIQQTDEGNPTPPSQQGETKDQLDPGFFPSPSSESQTLSEQASIGRRRKLGSHRKSHGQNYNEDQSAKTFYMEHQSRFRSDPDDDKTKATESDCQDKVPKDDESSKTPLSSFALTKNGENAIIMGKQTSVQSLEAGKDIQNKIPLTGIPKEVETSTNHYNVLMIGDTSVGKTSFIKRAQSGKFSLAVPSSVGLDTCKWTVMVDGKPVVLHVWDTAGQERFRSITRQIFHRAQAFLLMYDISSSHSFSAVSYWANCIQDSAGENVIILLVGNKCDRAERQVRREEGENLAKEHKFAFSECSAASGENVIECLETVARMLSQRSDSKRDATLLHNEGGKTKRSTCC